MHLSMRRNRQERVLAPVELDKGKRHYWGNQKGDYGFYESSDKKQLRQLNQYRRQSLHHRHYTTEIQAYDQQKQTELSNLNTKRNYDLYLSERQINPETSAQKRKSRLQLNSNNIQIQLPAIKRKIKQTTPQIPAQAPKTQSNKSRLTNFQEKGMHIVNPELNNRIIKQMRAKTQASDYGDKRAYRIRYSPTYVCSFSNPLPTFKLYETNNGKLQYQYGFGSVPSS